jgi:hypothetical protein
MLLKSLRENAGMESRGQCPKLLARATMRPLRHVSQRGRGAPLFAIWKTARPLYRRVPV